MFLFTPFRIIFTTFFLFLGCMTLRNYKWTFSPQDEPLFNKDCLHNGFDSSCSSVLTDNQGCQPQSLFNTVSGIQYWVLRRRKRNRWLLLGSGTKRKRIRRLRLGSWTKRKRKGDYFSVAEVKGSRISHLIVKDKTKQQKVTHRGEQWESADCNGLALCSWVIGGMYWRWSVSEDCFF